MYDEFPAAGVGEAVGDPFADVGGVGVGFSVLRNETSVYVRSALLLEDAG